MFKKLYHFFLDIIQLNKKRNSNDSCIAIKTSMIDDAALVGFDLRKKEHTAKYNSQIHNLIQKEITAKHPDEEIIWE